MPRGRLARAGLRIWLVSLALAVCAAGAAAQTGDGRRSPADFSLRARVTGEPAPGEACAVPLGADAVSALETGGELRVFDADGREIPSLVHTARRHAEEIERPVEIFNRAWQEDGTRTLSAELRDGARPVNEFVLEIPEDHHLLARVEGSPDGEHWQILADGRHLIRYSAPDEDAEYVYDRLRIPTSRFGWYRFTLHPLAPTSPGDESFRVQSVSVLRSVDRGARLELPVVVEPLDDPRDSDPRHAFWKLDLQRPGLGVSRIELEIPGDDFARSASLWEWSTERERRTRRLATAVVFRFGKEQSTAIGGFQTDAPLLALMIDQGDDEPIALDAARASRPRQTLRFIVPEDARPPLWIYLEPDQARPPRYDLARRLQEREIDRFVALEQGPVESNPDYREAPAPRSERLPWLLYLLVVPLVVVLAAYVVRTLRRGLPDDDPGSGDEDRG